ncbi:hypothetical protein [Faecalibacterium prausnitzii]|uniref:hypothetical protein n=1 Tax=Faecalibacterium prausnitzii TaxID=853 RepID=UPI001CBF7508|nr:hypothetical protein [Faecalibacterium prausnitzii]
MKKRWFVVILTIGLLLHVLPLSVLALSPDPTIMDSDGTILDWSDLSTVPYSLDDSPEQQLAVVNADNDEEAADDRSAGNLTLKTLDEESDDEESGDEESGDEESGDEESDDDDPADADRDEATDDLPAGNPPPPSLLTRNWRAMALRTTAAPQPRLCARSTRSTIRTTTPHWTMQSLRRRMVIRSTC